MWALKTVHLPERIRNFNRHKHLILAFLISAVLVISIIYMEIFSPIAKSGSGGSSNSFKVYIGNATMTNVLLNGSYTYNSLKVTMTTADVANMSQMLLVKEGSRLELAVPSAFATKLVVYTTYLRGQTLTDGWPNITCYGYENITFPSPKLLIRNMYMEVVYMQVESFSAMGLSLTCA